MGRGRLWGCSASHILKGKPELSGLTNIYQLEELNCLTALPQAEQERFGGQGADVKTQPWWGRENSI